MNKWTKGPWRVGKIEESCVDKKHYCPIIAANWFGLAEIPIIDDYDEVHEDGKANAHLIAAAPELYEALNTVLDALGAINKPWELEGYGFTPKKAEEIVGVLAKARGEE